MVSNAKMLHLQKVLQKLKTALQFFFPVAKQKEARRGKEGPLHRGKEGPLHRRNKDKIMLACTGARPKAPDSQKIGNTGDFYEACVALDCFYSVLKSYNRREEDEDDGNDQRNRTNLAEFKFGLQLHSDARKFDDVIVGIKIKGKRVEPSIYTVLVSNNLTTNRMRNIFNIWFKF